MNRLLKSRDYLMKSLGFVLLFGFISLGAIGGCNDDNANAQGDAGVELDFLIDVISGAVLENPEGEVFILELEVSPIMVFIEESPGNRSGSINTEVYLENFNEIIGDVPPNAVLTYRAEDGTTVAVAVKLNSVVFDTSESVAEFLVTPLDQITNSSPPGKEVHLISVEMIDSPFGQARLFIDADVTLTFINNSEDDCDNVVVIFTPNDPTAEPIPLSDDPPC